MLMAEATQLADATDLVQRLERRTKKAAQSEIEIGAYPVSEVVTSKRTHKRQRVIDRLVAEGIVVQEIGHAVDTVVLDIAAMERLKASIAVIYGSDVKGRRIGLKVWLKHVA